MLARDLQIEMGYADWRNFHNLIEKAKQILGEDCVTKTSRSVQLPKKAKRNIVDYELSERAVKFIRIISGKPTAKNVRVRNEIIIIEQLKRYYHSKNIPIVFQFKLASFRYDCKIGDKILFEFDEQHHQTKRQIIIDSKKTKYAELFGFIMLRAKIEDDVVDIIIRINDALSKMNE